MNWPAALRKIALFLGAVVIIAVALLIYAFYHRQGNTPPSAPANINCLQSSQYLVVDQNPGMPNLHIIAKPKTSANEAVPCNAATSSSDIIIENDLPEDVIGLVNQFLIIDSGTAPPPRGLIIYDIDAQTSTFTDTYSPPVTIASDTITYWEVTKQAPTAANCSNLSQLQADGLGAVIEEQVTLNPATLKKTLLGKMQCEATQ